MKIGITCGDIVFTDNIRIFSNGHHYNVLLWYYFFKNCGYDVVYLSDVMKTGYIINDENVYEVINYKDTLNDKYLENSKIDMVLFAGLTDSGLGAVLKTHGIKRVYSMMGNNYVTDIETVVYDMSYNRICDEYDEIWISPHFGYSIEYYKIRYRMDNIHIGPYLWGDDLVRNSKSVEYIPGSKLNVAICEANISGKKNCMIPLCICEKGEKYIDMVRCYGTQKLRDNKLFVSFCSNLSLHKNKKAVFNNREPIVDILSKCNCVISTTQEWDLNYVFLECFYYGIPLIHNSKILEDYGYYYPDLDINKAAKQIETVFKTHNTKLYIEKHKPLLYKYSIHNTYYQEWVKSRLITMVEPEKNTSIEYQNDVTIILTTTVNVQPHKSFIYQTDKYERLNTYLYAIRQWLEKTKFKIILVENTNYKFDELKDELSKYKDRFEIISYHESELSRYNEIKDSAPKGISEMYAINYAFDNSKIINNSPFIIKITGRYFVPEFEQYLYGFDLKNYDCLSQSKNGIYKNLCEIVGCNKKIFKTFFSVDNVEPHVENTYAERCSTYENVLTCKVFQIEPTQMGGISEIRTTL